MTSGVDDAAGGESEQSNGDETGEQVFHGIHTTSSPPHYHGLGGGQKGMGSATIRAICGASR